MDASKASPSSRMRCQTAGMQYIVLACQRSTAASNSVASARRTRCTARSTAHACSMKYQPAMWNSPNMTTSPARPGEPASASRATRAQPTRSVRDERGLGDSGGPAGEEDGVRVFRRADAGERRGGCTRPPIVGGDHERQVERIGHGARLLSRGRVGDDQPRAEILDGGARLGLGEPGVDRCERGAELRRPRNRARARRSRWVPTTPPDRGGRHRRAPSRCAAWLDARSRSPKVRCSSPRVAAHRAGDEPSGAR